MVTDATPAFAAVNCTFSGDAGGLIPGVNAGTVVNISCSGMSPGQTVAVAQAAAVASIASDTQGGYADQTHVLITNADGSGNLNTSFTVRKTGDATFPFTPTNADANAQCPATQAQVNVGVAVCSLAVADVATQSPLAVEGLFFAGTPAPSVTPTVTLQQSSAAIGNTITVTGAAGWWGVPNAPTNLNGNPIPAPTVLVGGVPATTSSVVVSGTSYSQAGGLNVGTLSGTFVVPAGATGTSNNVQVLQADTTPFPGNGPGGTTVMGVTSLAILGTPTLTATPTSAGSGTTVSISGSNWDPQGGTVALSFTSGTGSGTATVNASGALTGSIQVTAGTTQGPNDILGSQPAATGGPLNASATFSVSAISTSCTGTPCAIQQVISQDIIGANITISEASSSVTLSSITLNGHVQHGLGSIQTVNVNDSRGTLVGWTMTGTMLGDFVNSSPLGNAVNNSIPASNLAWTPAVSLEFTGPPDGPSGDLSQVTAGGATSLSTAVGQTLCAAPSGGGGGSYLCNAGLDLTIPPTKAKGTYTATLNLTIV